MWSTVQEYFEHKHCFMQLHHRLGNKCRVTADTTPIEQDMTNPQMVPLLLLSQIHWMSKWWQADASMRSRRGQRVTPLPHSSPLPLARPITSLFSPRPGFPRVHHSPVVGVTTGVKGCQSEPQLACESVDRGVYVRDPSEAGPHRPLIWDHLCAFMVYN